MESEFDNIKEVDYYNSRNFYPTDENTTSNSHAIDAKQLRWTPNDNLNNIINEEVKQTSTTTTTTTTTTSNNGQFDDNLLYSSDNTDLNQKIPPSASDDNNLHHASTLENNGEELLATGYDNKTELLSSEIDNDHQKILEKNQPHHQLGDTDADYGPETCVDVTDDVVMMTENSADTNNLLEQSTLSHSKDTLPSSDNCNPFDNKNTLDMEDANEFQLGVGGGIDAHLQLDDANKSTPLLSPEVEDLPLSSDGGLQFTNEGFQQSPLDDEIPVALGSHQQQIEFEDEFMQSNGHLSPLHDINTEEKKLDVTQKLEEQEDIESLAKLERFGDLTDEKVNKEESNEKVGEDIVQLQTDLDEEFLGNQALSPVIPEKDNIFEKVDNDESDFRLKDEEEILEKHVEASFTEKELHEPAENNVMQLLQSIEDDVLEEKPILTGSFTEKQITEVNFDDLSTQSKEEEKLSDFADEKQDKEEFSEKEGKAEAVLESLSFVEQKFAPSGEIELEEDECIHLEEDVRPSDYLAMLERQKEEHQQLCNVVEGFEKEAELDEQEPQVEDIKVEQLENKSDFTADDRISDNEQPVVENVFEKPSENVKQLEKPLFEVDDRLSDKVEQEFEKDERLSEKEEERYEEDEKLTEQLEQPREQQQYETDEKLPDPKESNELVKDYEEDENLSDLSEKQHEADEKLDKQVDEIEQNEHYDVDENLSVGTEQREQERHLSDIELMSQQFDRFEKEDQAEDRLNIQLEQQLLDANDKLTELVKTEEDNLQLHEEIGQLEELQQLDDSQVNEIKEDTLSQEIEQFPDNNKLESELKSLVEEPIPVVEDSIAQPEKQCFEEPEKLVKEGLPQQEIDNLDLQPAVPEELPIAEPENKTIDEDSVEKTEQPLPECTEKLPDCTGELPECTEEQLAKVEKCVLDLAPVSVKPLGVERKLFEDFEQDPEELVEVFEEPIIKEQVEIKPSLPVSSQEPSAVPPTHESCDESEDDEWKYMKEGQGEKQLLGLQEDIVVEEELQHHLHEAGALSVDEKVQLPATTLTEQISATASDQVESIKDTFESLTQDIAQLAESAAATTDQVVDKIGDTLEKLNLSQSSTREKLDNIEDDEDISASEMNSKLNPEAKEFVPTFSPTTVPVELANGFGIPAPTAIPHHFKDELLAQSPRKGRESNMENINIPAENEFEEEIANKPHGLPGDEAILEHAENGGLYQEMNWKEAMHGSEKEEGPLVDSPLTEESLEVVDNVLEYAAAPNVCEFSAPVGLDNAGMKDSIYIENNTSNEEDVLNTVQMLPVDSESKENSFEVVNSSKEVISPLVETVPANDAVTKEDVKEILTLASDEKKENKIDEEFEQKMEQLLLSHDKEITRDVNLEAEQVPINGVEMSPTTTETTEAAIIKATIDQQPIPVADEALAGLSLGAAAAVAVAATTAAVKKVEAEKNQKNLNKTSSATKSKVPDAKKPTTGLAAKTTAAKRISVDKPKPAATSSLATKKTVSSTISAAPRPRTAPSVGIKSSTEKKTTTTTTSTAKSRIDTKPPSTLTARKPVTSSATKTTTSKPTDEAKSSSSTVKSTSSSKSIVGSKTSVGSSKPTSATNSITKPRPATASSAATTNGTATKIAASKPTSLAPKGATNTKSSLTSPRGTLTSTLRKTEAIKSPTKTTSTITSRVGTNSTNGTKTTTTTRTTTTKTTSTVPTAAARTTTTTTRRTTTGTSSSTVGATTPTSKTNNLVPRKSTPLKKTSSSTPSARKSIGANAKPTKDTTTPRPVTIPAHHQNNNSIVAAEPKDVPLVAMDISNPPTDNGEPKLNGITSPDDVTSPTAPLAHPLELEIA